MNLAIAISHARPEAQWSLTGDDYKSLQWIGPGEPPTMEELTAAWQAYNDKLASDKAKRQQIRDIIDALEAGTGTTTVRLARVEKCVAYLMRHTLLVAILFLTACAQPTGNVQHHRVWCWQTEGGLFSR